MDRLKVDVSYGGCEVSKTGSGGRWGAGEDGDFLEEGDFEDAYVEEVLWGRGGGGAVCGGGVRGGGRGGVGERDGVGEGVVGEKGAFVGVVENGGEADSIDYLSAQCPGKARGKELTSCPQPNHFPPKHQTEPEEIQDHWQWWETLHPPAACAPAAGPAVGDSWLLSLLSHCVGAAL